MDKIFRLIKKEKRRQESTLMMIPSENYSYREVREAVGSILMHKYAEGQPGKRYYQGNVNMDEIESLCEERALSAFSLNPNSWFANVQPLSGSPANLAVYSALLQPGEKILSMYLPDGGHLSHGWYIQPTTGTQPKKISFTSKIFEVEFYYVDRKTLVFNYDQIEKKALQFKPKMIISGGTAYPREINHKRLSQIAKKVGAYYLADVAHEAGLIAGGANSSPFPYADVVTMTTHKTLRGPRGAIIIGKKKYEESIDFAVFPGLQGGPHMHTIAAIAVALKKVQSPQFKNYARQTVNNAKRLALDLMEKGYEVVSGGTDKHLILIDLRKSNTNGWIASHALEEAGIIVNRNTVPLEDASPFYPSGIRLGTPAITVRGMKEKEMDKIAEWIFKVIEEVKSQRMPADKSEKDIFMRHYLKFIQNNANLIKIKKEVEELCKSFPVLS
jgi:glycine hydroxymethyltransferase